MEELNPMPVEIADLLDESPVIVPTRRKIKAMKNLQLVREDLGHVARIEQLLTLN
jgi:hypothetical protein